MKKDNSIYLKDIQNAIIKIEEYTKDISFESFRNEDMRQDAVIRQFEIIGEAASRISKDFLEQHSDFPIKEAIEMRNFLIHGYDEVDIKVVWKTLQEDIPLLKNKMLSIQ
ncbi:DUF86 domain-containing protein [Candidatus Roizmanbacteria bacterium CG_4_10_14_3_um_filter_39_13]|uniref:DUF86 domain-containing protein n=1 Tax=Candidatus Roizmanbacteria bacterium CG_4_10_14_3_um_filter_39_13 TaxID=1974831 RepID=A0A2M7LLA6_9BACT|nr:MAG: DUF86 domain-containing protein [Candidatus Roizmanbacteria bacterium CG_4_10_14_3_um_filter_39_13]